MAHALRRQVKKSRRHEKHLCLLPCVHQQEDIIVYRMLVENLKQIDNDNNDEIDINRRIYKGQTILHLAIKFNETDIIAKLLKDNADINAKDNKGNTPLHCAIKYRSKETVERLLKKGANLEERNSRGETPLLYACTFKWSEMVAILLEKGANAHTQDILGRTAIHIAGTDSFGDDLSS